MIIRPSVVGIDISKHHLDIFDTLSGAATRIDNTRPAIKAMVSRLQANSAFVVFEATGSYDKALTLALEASGIAFARVNPAQARDFARACGRLAKTDRIDARMLADMGSRLALTPTQAICPKRRKLNGLAGRRDQLVDTRTQEKTRIKEADDDDLKQSLQDHIDWLNAYIEDLERQIETLIEDDRDLTNQATLMRSVPGVGPVTATTLLALMPELGTRSRRTIAALAGLAPINADSGQYRGTRRIRGGRWRVRKALYMAAVSAVRTKSRFKTAYQAMIAAAKPPKIALIAIARKILVTLNAMLREQRPFTA